MHSGKHRNGKKICVLVLCLVLSITLCYSTFVDREIEQVEIVWGENIKLDQDIRLFIDTNIMKRIRDVDQSGPARFFGPKLPKFSRFDHCVGVWVLLKKAGVDIGEQIAGLLHDASHTVFSHVADYIFTNNKNVTKYTDTSYQDTVHMRYIKQSNLKDQLGKLNLKEEDLNPDNPKYLALEQPLPDMCADRIHYNIHTGVLLGVISKKEARDIVQNLCYQNGKWFFTDIDIATKFAELSLHFTKHFWGAKWNASMNYHLAVALKRAMQIKLIKYTDLYLTDSVILSKLNKNQDRIIQIALQQCRFPIEKMCGQKYNVIKFTPKFRGIDPLVKMPGEEKLARLSEMNQMFNKHYNNVKKWCEKGYTFNALTFDE